MKNFTKYNYGESNLGNHNFGECNSGEWNCGDYNSGYCNTGHYNIGNYNSGDYNFGSYNAGVFNTENNPKIYMFDKLSKWRAKDWVTSIARDILEKMPRSKENRQDWWNELSKKSKKQILNLPNFNRKIFFKITGIKVALKDYL